LSTLSSIMVLVAAVFVFINVRRQWAALHDVARLHKVADDNLLKAVTIATDHINTLNGMIAHLYAVISAIPMPSHARKLLEMGPNGMPKNEAERRKFVSDVNMENYKEMRDKLSFAMEHAEDPDEKKRLGKMLEEADGLYNLFCTIDEKSSPEYFAQIMGEIPATLRRIMDTLQGG